MELRLQASRLIRGAGDLFPRQHVAAALAKAEARVAPTPVSPSGEICETSAKKRQLKAECRALRHQLLEKKASEEAFLNNMMVFFKDEDGKSIGQRMQIQDLVDQHEELQKWPRQPFWPLFLRLRNSEQQDSEAEALHACLQLMVATLGLSPLEAISLRYAEDAKQRNSFLIETLTQLLSNQPTLPGAAHVKSLWSTTGETHEATMAWRACVTWLWRRDVGGMRPLQPMTGSFRTLRPARTGLLQLWQLFRMPNAMCVSLGAGQDAPPAQHVLGPL